MPTPERYYVYTTTAVATRTPFRVYRNVTVIAKQTKRIENYVLRLPFTDREFTTRV